MLYSKNHTDIEAHLELFVIFREDFTDLCYFLCAMSFIYTIFAANQN